MKVGDKLTVWTVGFAYTGEVVASEPGYITLVNAALVGDFGRFHEYAAGAPPLENEPFPADYPLSLARGSIIGWGPRPNLDTSVI